jgi:type I restriction enzyme, S subunit
MFGGWPSVRLEDACVRVTDGTHQSPRFESHGIPFLVISDIVSGEIDWSRVSKWVNEATYEANTARCRPERGDVLYTAVGSFGVAVPVEFDQRFMFQRHIAHIKPDPSRLHTRFLAHILNSPEMRAVAERVAKGVAQRTVTLGDLKSFEIPLPPLAEQRRIADILDKADAIRRKRKEAIALTEQLLRSTFLDMFGDPVTNPKGWAVKALGDLLSNIDSGWSPVCEARQAAGDEWGVLKLGAVTFGRYNESEHKALSSGTSPLVELEVRPGDILFSRKNTYEHVAACVFVSATRRKLMLPDLIFRLVLREPRELVPEVLWAILSDPRKRRQVQGLAGGTAGSMPNISKERLRSVELPVPALPLQLQFAALLRKSEHLRAELEASAREADSLFSTLVARSFAGGMAA